MIPLVCKKNYGQYAKLMKRKCIVPVHQKSSYFTLNRMEMEWRTFWVYAHAHSHSHAHIYVHETGNILFDWIEWQHLVSFSLCVCIAYCFTIDDYNLFQFQLNSTLNCLPHPCLVHVRPANTNPQWVFVVCHKTICGLLFLPLNVHLFSIEWMNM